MATATCFSSDFDVYKTSTDAVLEKFKDGKLYSENRDQYFATIISVCNHFKHGLNNVDKGLNEAIIASQNFDAKHVSACLDFIYEVFDILEDYVEFICDDFNDFKKTVTNVVPKENLPYRSSIDFNDVDQLVMDLHKKVERIRTELLSQFVTKLSDDQLKRRAI